MKTLCGVLKWFVDALASCVARQGRAGHGVARRGRAGQGRKVVHCSTEAKQCIQMRGRAVHMDCDAF